MTEQPVPEEPVFQEPDVEETDNVVAVVQDLMAEEDDTSIAADTEAAPGEPQTADSPGDAISAPSSEEANRAEDNSDFESPIDDDPVPVLANYDEDDLLDDPAPGRLAWLKWLILAILLAAGGLALILFESKIVAAWPPAQKLYEWIETGKEMVLGKEFTLQITNITSEYVRESGRQVLIVRGKVDNVGKKTSEVPRLRIYLLDSKGKPLYDWQVPLARNQLEAGGSLSFTSRLPNPNKDGRKLAVRFNL